MGSINQTTMSTFKQCIFLISISALPFAALGLQCYSFDLSLNSVANGGVLTPELKNCSETTKACFIGSNSTYTIQSCSTEKLYTGCITIPLTSYKTCFCETDGCNENVAKAGSSDLMVSVFVLITIVVLLQ